MKIRNVCVIGAGIAGTSVAFHLSRYPGVRVSIVDSGYPGAGTTEAGTGWISARSADPQYRALRALAMQEHHRLAELFPAASWMTLGGILQQEDAPAEGGNLPDFDDATEELRSFGFPLEVLTAAEVNAKLEPHIAFERPDLRVAHLTDEFTIAGAQAARSLFSAAVANGATGHIGSRVVGIDSLPHDRHRVVLDDGTTLDADTVVNAAGAQADDIAALYNVEMPLRPQPGIGSYVRVEGRPLGRLLLTKDLAAKPEAAGVIKVRTFFGWNTNEGAATRINSFTGGMDRNEYMNYVVKLVEALLPTAGPVHPITSRVGIRPFPADGMPRVGEVDGIPGYFEAVTHSGATLGPLIGRLLSNEIVAGELSPELADYRPARFLPA